METASRMALLVALGLTLAACGGSSDEEDRPSFGDLEDQGTALADEFQALALTDPSNLPTEGSATYEGVVGIGSAEEGGAGRIPDMAGELTLEVDFDGDEISGEADNFVTRRGEEMEGSLDIDGGRIYRDADPADEDSFAAVLSGQLEDEDGAEFDFGGSLVGDFAGSSHSHAGGQVEGGVATPEGSDRFEGEFVVER